MHPSMPMEYEPKMGSFKERSARYKPLIFSNGIQIPFPTPTRSAANNV